MQFCLQNCRAADSRPYIVIRARIDTLKLENNVLTFGNTAIKSPILEKVLRTHFSCLMSNKIRQISLII